jgi:hypothetical protein
LERATSRRGAVGSPAGRRAGLDGVALVGDDQVDAAGVGPRLHPVRRRLEGQADRAGVALGLDLPGGQAGALDLPGLGGGADVAAQVDQLDPAGLGADVHVAAQPGRRDRAGAGPGAHVDPGRDLDPVAHLAAGQPQALPVGLDPQDPFLDPFGGGGPVERPPDGPVHPDRAVAGGQGDGPGPQVDLDPADQLGEGEGPPLGPAQPHRQPDHDHHGQDDQQHAHRDLP